MRSWPTRSKTHAHECGGFGVLLAPALDVSSPGGCFACRETMFEREGRRGPDWAVLTVLFTIPVTGTALYIVDQYLHPRTLATALILFAIPEILDRRFLRAGILIVLAALVHIQMAFFGGLFLAFLAWPWIYDSLHGRAVLFGFPLATLFEPGSPAWREAMLTREQHFLLKWHWYEWLGIVAPLALLWWIGSMTTRKLASRRSRWISRHPMPDAVLVRQLLLRGRADRNYSSTPGTPHALPADARLPPSLSSIVPAPRGTALRTRAAREDRRLRPLLLVTAIGMFYAQHDLFPGTRHIEWPGRDTGNRWVRAFVWIRENTPREAYFAIDPRYMQRPGEDEHGFRAFAERSVLADWDKDPGVVCLFPALGPEVAGAGPRAGRL